MSVYSSSAESLRDTTKWLTAFVPIASVVAAASLLGPRLLADAQLAHSAGQWFTDNLGVVIGLLVATVGIAVILLFGAKVLSAQPRDFAALMTSGPIATALSNGVGVPYFLDDRTFKDAIAELQVQWSDQQPVLDAALSRSVAAVDMLRDWSLLEAVIKSFYQFRWAFIVGIAAISGGFLLSIATLGPSAASINEPQEVEITVEQAGAADLLAATGCTDPGRTSFQAFGGTWNKPILRVDGPNCRFGASWVPSADLIELRLHASH